jgi:uncharacterized membrane protein YkvA (DUF1232 family)
MSKWIQRLPGEIKRDILVLWLAARDPRTPWLAKLVAGLTAAYILSPVQLIPNFIPVLGYLDDVLFATFGIWAMVRLLPGSLISELRERAQTMDKHPTSWITAIVVITLWSGLLALIGAAILRKVR